MRRRATRRSPMAALAAALVLGGLLAWSAGAQPGRKTGFSDTLTVSQVLPAQGRLVARQDDGTTRTFVVEPKTEILDGDRHVPLESLASGTRVTVDATYEEPEKGTGPLKANRIEVVRAGTSR